MKFHQNDLSNHSFLVTGGAGFIGSHIVAYLLAHGAKKVHVLDNLATGLMSNVELFKNYPNYEKTMKDLSAKYDIKEEDWDI